MDWVQLQLKPEHADAAARCLNSYCLMLQLNSCMPEAAAAAAWPQWCSLAELLRVVAIKGPL